VSRRRPRTEHEIEGLRALAGQPLEGPARATVERALERGRGLVAGRAALLVADADARDLGPALERSFQRFLLDPVKTDPGCAAKRAIVKALSRLEVDAAETLRRGARHVQMEPVWGGRADSAGELRGLCGQALVSAGDRYALLEVARLLSDPAVEARRLAARAAGVVRHDAAEVLLRAKVHAGDDDPDVLGECFTSLLQVAPERSLEFVATFLDDGQVAVAAVAALALGETREPEALEHLVAAWEATVEADRREALILPVALTRRDRAIDFLIERLTEQDRRTAVAAARALRLHRGDDAVVARVRAALAERGDSEVENGFEQEG